MLESVPLRLSSVEDLSSISSRLCFFELFFFDEDDDFLLLLLLFFDDDLLLLLFLDAELVFFVDDEEVLAMDAEAGMRSHCCLAGRRPH